MTCAYTVEKGATKSKHIHIIPQIIQGFKLDTQRPPLLY